MRLGLYTSLTKTAQTLKAIPRPGSGPLSPLRTQAQRPYSFLPTRTARTLYTAVTWRNLANSGSLKAFRHLHTASVVDMDSNGAKRKEHPEQIHDRPLKQFRGGVDPSLPAANGTDTSADQTPNGYLPDAPDSDSRSLVHTATADSAEWQATIETVVSKVVSIHFCQTSAFDTDPALSSEATGFVVDEENGYIMTNRVGGLEARKRT